MRFGFHLCLGLVYLLLVELVVEFCIFYLLAQVVILTVVAHRFRLSLETCDIGIVHLYVSLSLRYLLLQGHNVLVEFLYTGGQALNLVFQVLHFQRQLATERADVVYLRQFCL